MKLFKYKVVEHECTIKCPYDLICKDNLGNMHDVFIGSQFCLEECHCIKHNEENSLIECNYDEKDIVENKWSKFKT